MKADVVEMGRKLEGSDLLPPLSMGLSWIFFGDKALCFEKVMD